MSAPPRDVLSAVTHPDPAGYYDRLATQPFHHDARLGAWIAASAEAVTAVLTDPNCRVRPPGVPVPPALLGSPGELIFRHLVRMNDGAQFCPFKRAMQDVIDALPTARVVQESRRWAEVLGQTTPLPDFAFDLPACVLSTLLGLPDSHAGQVARLMHDFAPCLAPTATAEHVQRGAVAAGALLDLFGGALSAPEGERPGLVTALQRAARRSGRDDPATVLANGIGLIWQSFEATAGLIGNTLLALVRHPSLRPQVTRHPELLRDVMLEVLRLDPPIQNTRRFVAEGGTLLGQAVRPGDAIVVVLAAANRDATIHPHPGRFDVTRRNRPLLTFGTGPHACPGQELALSIAGAGVEACLAGELDLERWAARVAYRPSVNARVPFAAPGARA